MKATDLDLARLALARGWISQDVQERALEEADRCQAMGLEKSVDEVLLDAGLLSVRQVHTLRTEIGWPTPRPRIADYEILRRIGFGGMGTVFEARHVRLRRHAALKILSPRYAEDPDLAERFLREARALARLNHPHIVHAFDSGRDGSTYYLAMEYVDGEDVRQILQRERTVNPLRSLEIVRDACSALTELEAKGLVHRDVKPANLLIDPQGRAKLTDLGVHGTIGGLEATRSRVVCGTPHYISPEVVTGRADADSRSDIYSLGATWYHMLVGQPPFVGKTSGEVLRAHLDRRPVPPSALHPGVSPLIDRTLLAWMQKDRAARPPGATAALEEVEDLLARLRPSRRRRIPSLRGLLGIARGGLPRGPILIRWAVAALAVALIAGGGLLAFRILLRDGLDVAEAPLASETPPPAPGPGPVGKGAAAASVPAPSSPAIPAGPASPEPPLAESPPPAAVQSDPSTPATVQPASSPPVPVHPGPAPAALAGEAGKRIRALLRGTGEAVGALREGAVARRLPLERLKSRTGALLPLARSFRATEATLEPVTGPVGAILRYRFRDASELRDFRAVPGSWRVEDGGLVYGARPEGENLESLAWFVPPLRIDLVLLEPAPLTVGLGSLRVAPGHGSAARGWTAEPGSEAPILVVPRAPAGTISVAFLRGGVEISASGETHALRIDVPERGRIVLRLAHERPLSSLTVDGRLDPVWTSERLRALEGR